jgi:hypothetical protein
MSRFFSDGRKWDVNYDTEPTLWEWVRATDWRVKLRYYFDRLLIRLGIKQPAGWLQPHQLSGREIARADAEREALQFQFTSQALARLRVLRARLPIAGSEQDRAAIQDSINKLESLLAPFTLDPSYFDNIYGP